MRRGLSSTVFQPDPVSHLEVCPPYCGPSDSQIRLIQLPKVQPQPMPPTQEKAPSGDTVSNITNLLDQSVFGIPVKYLAIGAAVYFMMRK